MAQPAGMRREKAEVCKLSPRGIVGRGGGSVCGLCQGAGEYFPVSAKAATLRGSSSAAEPGTRLSLHPHPHPHPPWPPPPEPLGAISAASARKARRADSVRTTAVWSRGGEEQERAPQRLPGRLSGKNARSL